VQRWWQKRTRGEEELRMIRGSLCRQIFCFLFLFAKKEITYTHIYLIPPHLTRPKAFNMSGAIMFVL
jgi:hypothetical protein